MSVGSVIVHSPFEDGPWNNIVKLGKYCRGREPDCGSRLNIANEKGRIDPDTAL
jgi:hypothetical protein